MALHAPALAGLSGTLQIGAIGDTFLVRDAANTVAQRNGTSAQAFRVYNTFTDASNGEWFEASWSGNALTLKTSNNGTGSARGIAINAAGGSVAIGTGGNTRIQVNDSNGKVDMTGAVAAILPQPQFSGTNTTGSGSAALGSNSPATTNTAPYTWIRVTTADGSTGYIPVWK